LALLNLITNGRLPRGGGPYFYKEPQMAEKIMPLMPHATAAWLVDNTGLAFDQIAEFCGIHILEVQAMADDMTSAKYTGRDPVRAGELTMDEIEKGQYDTDYRLKMQRGPDQVRRTKGPRYTPVSKRQDKPDGIAWLLRNHPEISTSAICKLIGTTRNTIDAIRERSHWNIAEIQPKDPVTLGLCPQRDLDTLVAKAAKKAGIAQVEVDPARLGDDRNALIVELRAEREAERKLAEDALRIAAGEVVVAPTELTAENLFKK
jgi:uncharacterized protein